MTARRARALLGALLALLLSGCVGLHADPRIQPGLGVGPADRDEVGFIPPGPQDGSSPEAVIRGFLRAAGVSGQGVAVARTYLTQSLAASWNPEDRAVVTEEGIEAFLDQVATDTRLWLKRKIAGLRDQLDTLQGVIIVKAIQTLNVIMPGYTHLQQAQPVRFSHWLLSYAWMFQRDKERLADLTKRVEVLPLGSGALAGNPFPIDRAFLAEQLGFSALSANSMDAVGDRDYILEFLGWAAITQVHLSRLAEDLIIYSSREFGFVEIDDAYSTGSSLMPQKKNADSLELIRGKTGRVVGDLTGLLTTLKGTPSTYNKDYQEDKEPLFDTVDTLSMTLAIAAGVVRTLEVNSARIYDSMDSAMLATELADYLVDKGMPFREAHHLVGRIVQQAIAIDQPLYSFPLAAYKQFSPLFDRDLHERLTFNRAADRRESLGGTGEAAVKVQIEFLRDLVDYEIDAALDGADQD